MSLPVRPTVIVLAAGRGSRFASESALSGSATSALGFKRAGGDVPRGDPAPHKLDQSLGASTVLGSTLHHVIRSGLPLIVVASPRMEALAREHVAARDVVVLHEVDTHPGFGMGRSIAAGVQARPQSPGWLVLPADMPVVRPGTLKLVAAALQKHPVVFAQHRGQRGHPVGFSSELYSELVALSGDEGARRVVARYPATAVEVDDAGILMDVDTADDLSLVRAYHAADQAAPH